MPEDFQPVFLKNSPSLICDQILYLVKNSNLNFELHETPFSLNLTLKKTFVHHWKKSNHSAQEAHVSQHANDLGPHHPPHHPSVGQPGHLSARPPRQTEDITLNQLHHPQQQAYIPQHHTPLVHSSHQQPNNKENITDPVKFPQHPPILGQAKAQELQTKLDLLKAEHKKTIAENLEAHGEYAELDKANRKLLKEHKELQAKHSKVCSEVKILKVDKEMVEKEMNALSVAMQERFRSHLEQFQKGN